MYDHVKSINSVTGTAVVHEVTVKNGLLTDIGLFRLQLVEIIVTELAVVKNEISYF